VKPPCPCSFHRREAAEKAELIVKAEALLRAKRALAHLMFKNHELFPSGCDGCKEVALFLSLPGYYGDANDPVLERW
jgi:hypothetical protein